MARTTRNPKLENRTNRLKLPAGKRYWTSVGSGIAMCYRRTAETFGTWQARLWLKDQYVYQGLGSADDTINADGIKTLDYFQAAEKARTWAQDLIQNAHDPNAKLRAGLTLGLAADHYLEWYEQHRKAYKDTKCAIEAHILPSFKERLVKDITSKDMRDWLDKLASTPARKRSKAGKKTEFHEAPITSDDKRARKASANRTLAIFKAILNKAFQDELVSDDAAWRRVKPFPKVDEPVIRFLTENESLRLLNACAPDFRELVHAALFTGARYSELTSLQASDFNPDTRQVFIRMSKSGKSRYIPLSSNGLHFFKAVTAGRTGNHPIFQKENGIIWGRNHQVRLLEDACKIASIEPSINFHVLRHTYASMLAQAGADLLTISKLLGHADTRITSRHYAHLCDKSLAEAVNSKLPSFGYKPENKVVSIK